MLPSLHSLVMVLVHNLRSLVKCRETVPEFFPVTSQPAIDLGGVQRERDLY